MKNNVFGTPGKGQLLLLHSSVALAAVYGSVVLGLERNFCFAAAVCANSSEEFLSCLTGILSCITAGLASLRLVLESALCIELLLACGENEIVSAVFTLKSLVFVHFATSL